MKARLCVYSQFNNAMRQDLWNNKAWLEIRLRIYRHVTLPSLLAQQDRDFDIILDCNPKSSAWLRRRSKPLTKFGARPIFDRGAEYFSSLRNDYDTLQILRIDSDDCYAPTAIAFAKEGFEHADAVQFYNGYWYSVKSHIMRRWRDKSPPFFGLQRPLAEVRTLYSFLSDIPRGHRFFRPTFAPKALPDGQFLVLQHRHNTSGRPGHGKCRENPRAVLARFGLIKSVRRQRK